MMLYLTGVACQMAQTWWLRKLVDLDRNGILHPIHYRLPFNSHVHFNHGDPVAWDLNGNSEKARLYMLILKYFLSLTMNLLIV